MTIFLLTLAAVLVAVGMVAFGIFSKFSFGGWSVELTPHLKRWQRAGVGLLSIAGGAALVTVVVAGSDSGGNNGDRSPTATTPAGQTPTSPTRSPSNCGPVEITLSTDSAPRGGQVTVNGICFNAGERVEIRVHVTVVGSATADSEGSFRQTITIPESAPPPGFPTSISATGQSSIKTASAPFTTR